MVQKLGEGVRRVLGCRNITVSVGLSHAPSSKTACFRFHSYDYHRTLIGLNWETARWKSNQPVSVTVLELREHTKWSRDVTNELLVLGIDGEVSEADGGRASDDVVREMRRRQDVDDDRQTLL